jgi:hypothetical protein
MPPRYKELKKLVGTKNRDVEKRKRKNQRYRVEASKHQPLHDELSRKEPTVGIGAARKWFRT